MLAFALKQLRYSLFDWFGFSLEAFCFWFFWLVGGFGERRFFVWFSLVVFFFCVFFSFYDILILGWEGLFGLGFCFSWFVYLFGFFPAESLLRVVTFSGGSE